MFAILFTAMQVIKSSTQRRSGLNHLASGGRRKRITEWIRICVRRRIKLFELETRPRGRSRGLQKGRDTDYFVSFEKVHGKTNFQPILMHCGECANCQWLCIYDKLELMLDCIAVTPVIIISFP